MFWRLAQWRISEHKTVYTQQYLFEVQMFVVALSLNFWVAAVGSWRSCLQGHDKRIILLMY